MHELFGFRTWALVTLNGGLQSQRCPWVSRQDGSTRSEAQIRVAWVDV